MSTPFTSPADASWQTLLDEITLAYSERRQAIGQSAYTPTDNKDVQDANYWKTFQDWLEVNCMYFVDYINGPLNPAGTDFLYFTLATWRAAAGINASGFRRVPEGVAWDGTNPPVGGYSYGKMQADDVIPAVFAEIQAGFAVLQWTMTYEGGSFYQTGYPSTCSSYQRQSRVASGSNNICEDAMAAMDTSWAAGWNPVSDGPRERYSAEASSHDNYLPSAKYYWYSGRTKSGSIITGIPTFRPHAATLYTAVFILAWNVSESEIDGYGMSPGLLWLWQNFAEATVATRISTILGDSEIAPVHTLGWTCPAAYKGIRVETFFGFWLLKWNFSNA